MRQPSIVLLNKPPLCVSDFIRLYRAFISSSSPFNPLTLARFMRLAPPSPPKALRFRGRGKGEGASMGKQLPAIGVGGSGSSLRHYLQLIKNTTFLFLKERWCLNSDSDTYFNLALISLLSRSRPRCIEFFCMPFFIPLIVC